MQLIEWLTYAHAEHQRLVHIARQARAQLAVLRSALHLDRLYGVSRSAEHHEKVRREFAKYIECANNAEGRASELQTRIGQVEQYLQEAETSEAGQAEGGIGDGNGVGTGW